MRKFLIPIINLVNVILVTIAFILGNTPAAIDKHTGVAQDLPRYYHLVWNAAEHANIIGIIGFFVFIAAAVLMLVNFLPIKARKCIAPVTGLMFVASGVLFLMTPVNADIGDVIRATLELSGSLIAMSVLAFIAGALTLGMSVLDFTAKKAE